MEYDADFEFKLFPYPKSYAIDVVDYMYDDAEYTIKSEEYENVLNLESEHNNMILVGEIGYYNSIWNVIFRNPYSFLKEQGKTI